MYDYDKILKETLDKLFEEDFRNVNEKKELKLGYTLLKIPKIDNEKLKSNNIKSEFNKKKPISKRLILSSVLMITLFLLIFYISYSEVGKNLLPANKASMSALNDIDFKCNIISEGELKTTGIGECQISNNKFIMKSGFNSLDDKVNYMIIVTNNSNSKKTIKRLTQIQGNEEINVSYKLFYNNKKFTSVKKINSNKITINKKQSVVIIVEQKLKDKKLDFKGNNKEFMNNIKIEF